MTKPENMVRELPYYGFFRAYFAFMNIVLYFAFYRVLQPSLNTLFDVWTQIIGSYKVGSTFLTFEYFWQQICFFVKEP